MNMLEFKEDNIDTECITTNLSIQQCDDLLNEQINILTNCLSTDENSNNNIKPVVVGTIIPLCCNCKQSQCRQKYCICFNKGLLCTNCKYKDCCNKLQPYYERMDWYRDNNIVKTCNCKSTKCLKKYCICFENGTMCNQSCKCTQCLNNDIFK